MRILQVSNGYPHRAYGGVELHTYRLANALVARGHELSVFTRFSDLGRPDGEVVDQVVDGVSVRSVVNDFKAGRFRDHYQCDAVAVEFRRTVRETRPDLVHFQHLIGLSADLPRIAREEGVRPVATIHEYFYICQRVMFQHRDGGICAGPSEQSCVDCVLGGDAPAEGAIARLGRALRGRSSVVGPAENRERFEAFRAAIGEYERLDTVAQFVADMFDRQGMPLPPDRTRVISLSIDRESFPPSRPPQNLPIRAERPLRVGFVGHALHHKGPHVLLEALRRLPDLPIELTLWGARHDGHPYDVNLESLLAAEARATHRGRFAEGALPEVLAEIDLLAVPSTCPESFGLATREAFAAGRAVVTTDRGALPESVRDGVDGLIVPGEDPGAMADALRRLVEDDELLPTLSRGAAESGERLKSMDDYAAEIEEYLYA